LRPAHLLDFRSSTQALVVRARPQTALEPEPRAAETGSVMRRTLRFLLCLILSCSIAFAAVPRQASLPEPEKTSCCMKTKTESVGHDCDHHAPKSDQEKQCCAACAFGLALFATAAAPFVYPPVGDESFAAFISSEQTRSQRPPVPPPRA